MRPEPQARTLDEFRHYTRHWSRPAALEPNAVFAPWGDADPPTHSLPAAVAGKVAASFGADAFSRFKLAALEAYFRHSRTISNRPVLLDIAQQVGLDREDFDARWRDRLGEFVEAVRVDHNDAIEQGVTGVPAVLVNGEYLLTGALETDQYRKVIDHLT